MKTNAAARRILKIRIVLTSLAIAVILAFELCLGVSMAGKIGTTSVGQFEVTPAPNVSLSDLFAAR